MATRHIERIDKFLDNRMDRTLSLPERRMERAFS
jgi:hypothetical protein